MAKYSHSSPYDGVITIQAEHGTAPRYVARIGIPLYRINRMERPRLFMRDEYRRPRQMLLRLTNQPKRT